MSDERIDVYDVPFVQVFEQGCQHSKITSRSVEFKTLFFGKILLQVFDKGSIGFLHGNIVHMVAMSEKFCQMLTEEQQTFQSSFTAVYTHPLTEAVDILVRMMKQPLRLAV